ncbi:MAG: ferritin family protein [Desulfobacterales bacterium]|jgi:rubrerythrin|nr:ferritin family protein [Desulfobacteraceae bacterium]MDD3990960.1 ferritin family protein [Desulfobacteraceae bacterium]MDY0312169.1 ferritin family protein [Desulfobacterales bacterium]
MFQLEEIIDIAVRLEENAAAVYRQAMDRVEGQGFKAVLQWMIEEEKQHARWFNDLRQQATTGANPIARAMNREMLAQMIGEQSFSLKQVDFTALTDINALIDVLVEFEKDTILFYEMLSGFIPAPEVLSQLQTIIAEEKRHITQLEAQRPTP